MKLNDEEQAMLAGEMGETLRWAIDHQRQVGMFFDAPDMVPVTQAHIMADPESLGDAGTSFVEQLAKRADRVRVPTSPTRAVWTSPRPTGSAIPPSCNSSNGGSSTGWSGWAC